MQREESGVASFRWAENESWEKGAELPSILLKCSFQGLCIMKHFSKHAFCQGSVRWKTRRALPISRLNTALLHLCPTVSVCSPEDYVLRTCSQCGNAAGAGAFRRWGQVEDSLLCNWGCPHLGRGGWFPWDPSEVSWGWVLRKQAYPIEWIPFSWTCPLLIFYHAVARKRYQNCAKWAL